MAALTPTQRRRRARIETLIAIMAPALDLMLAAGERVSRLVEPEDQGYYPPRSESAELPPPPSHRSR